MSFIDGHLLFAFCLLLGSHKLLGVLIPLKRTQLLSIIKRMSVELVKNLQLS